VTVQLWLLPVLLGGLTWNVVARAAVAWGPPAPRVGALMARRRPHWAGRATGAARSPPLWRGRRPLVLAATAVVPLAVVGLPAVVFGGVVLAVGPRVHRAAERRRREAAVAADLPEVVDLLTVAVGAGLTVPKAVAVVAGRATGPLARALAATVADAEAGRPFADALDDLPDRAGEPTRALAASLAGCVRYGTPIASALAALAAEARDSERRRLEQAARRVPVLLLFPLVLCVLPAFALLTVAPLIADALRALRL
jgi:tight adherence protein C